MDDVLSKVLGYLIALFVFIFVIISIVTQYQGAMEDQIKQKSTEFINDCRETGQIKPDAFARVNQIIATYGHYNVQFRIERKKEYSEWETDTVNGVAQSYLATRTGYETIDTNTIRSTRNNQRNYREYYSSGRKLQSTFHNVGKPRTFAEVMADGDVYNLKAVDRVFIKVTEGRGNFATRLKNFLFHGGDTGQTVIVNYGGEVGA